MIDQLAAGREGHDPEGGILAVDRRNGRIDQDELRVVSAAMDDAKVIGVIVAREHGGDGVLMFGHEVIEEVGPIGLPHRNDGPATKIVPIRGLEERPVAGHGRVTINARRDVKHEPDLFPALFGAREG